MIYVVGIVFLYLLSIILSQINQTRYNLYFKWFVLGVLSPLYIVSLWYMQTVVITHSFVFIYTCTWMLMEQAGTKNYPYPMMIISGYIIFSDITNDTFYNHILLVWICCRIIEIIKEENHTWIELSLYLTAIIGDLTTNQTELTSNKILTVAMLPLLFQSSSTATVVKSEEKLIDIADIKPTPIQNITDAWMFDTPVPILGDID